MEYTGNRPRSQRGNYYRMSSGCCTGSSSASGPGSRGYAQPSGARCGQSRTQSPSDGRSQGCTQSSSADHGQSCTQSSYPESGQSRTQSSCTDRGQSCDLNQSLRLGICYVPMQRFEQLYPADKALMAGTIFAELDFPFTAACCKGGRP